MKFFKFALILLILNLQFVDWASAYPNTRPTDEAVNTDIGLCTPGWVTLGTCLFWFKYARSNRKAQIACGVSLGAYCALRTEMEEVAENFRNDSRVANHQDYDSNGLNDFATDDEAQSCAALVGQAIPGSGEAVGDITRYYTEDNFKRKI